MPDIGGQYGSARLRRSSATSDVVKRPVRDFGSDGSGSNPGGGAEADHPRIAMHRALVVEPMSEDADREPAGAGASGGGGRPGVPGSLVQVAIGVFGFLALVGGGAATFVLRSETAAVAALVGGFALLIAAAVLPRLTEV